MIGRRLLLIVLFFLVLLFSRREGRHDDRISALEEENDRLREEIEKLKKIAGRERIPEDF